jgi:hypothetical protein
MRALTIVGTLPSTSLTVPVKAGLGLAAVLMVDANLAALTVDAGESATAVRAVAAG